MKRDDFLYTVRQLAQGIPIPTENESFIRMLEDHGCTFLLSQIPSRKADTTMELAIRQAVLKQRYAACAPVFADLANIPYAVIKGAILSQQIYRGPAYRMSGDIDLLIAPENVPAVKSVLEGHGFVQGRVVGDKIVPYTRQELIYQKTFTHQMAAFVKATGNRLCPFVNMDINLDIFWGESSQKTDMCAFLHHRESYTVLGVEVQKLNPVYEFISLCMHHYKDWNSLYLLADRSIKLGQFCDIYYYLTKVSPDSAKLQQVCQMLGVEKYIAYCIYHTYQIFADDQLIPYLYALAPQGNYDLYFRFGLTEEEYKYPGFGISDMVTDPALWKKLQALLTEKDLQKIATNRKFM